MIQIKKENYLKSSKKKEVNKIVKSKKEKKPKSKGKRK